MKGMDERTDEGVLQWVSHMERMEEENIAMVSHVERMEKESIARVSHVERMEKERTAKRVCVGDCAGSRSVGRPRKRLIDTMKDC